MNSISSRTESKEETVVTESDDGNGNAVRTETTVTKTYLYITVTHKTADEMAEEYGFSKKQREMIEVLLKEENEYLWEWGGGMRYKYMICYRVRLKESKG